MQASSSSQAASQQQAAVSVLNGWVGSGLVLHLPVPDKPKKGPLLVKDEFPELALPKQQHRIDMLRRIKERTDAEALAEKQAEKEARASRFVSTLLCMHHLHQHSCRSAVLNASKVNTCACSVLFDLRGMIQHLSAAIAQERAAAAALPFIAKLHCL